MATELALHAYVFLGNALNLMVNGAGAPQLAELGATTESLKELYGKIEPMTPSSILAGVCDLTPEERRLLLRVCLWCVERLQDEFETSAGVSEPEANQVVAWLEQGVGGG